MAALVMLSAALLLGLLLPSSMANKVLYGCKDLLTDEYLSDGNNVFIMQSDCNLVLYHNGREVWSSNTTGLGHNCFARMQTNGNLVIFNDNNQVVWSSNTAGKQDRYILLLHPYGYVIIYEPKWTQPNSTDTSTNRKIVTVKRGHSETSIPAEDSNILYTNLTLLTGESLTEENYSLVMQSDCALVLYDDSNNKILWSTETNGAGQNCNATMQGNGDLVIFNDKNEVVWSSNTAGEEDKYILFLYPDGHIIIYEPKWTQPNYTDNSTNRKIAMVTKN